MSGPRPAKGDRDLLADLEGIKALRALFALGVEDVDNDFAIAVLY